MKYQHTPTAAVLVVDDNDISRKLLTTYIESMGYRALTANDGAQALEILGSDTIGLVLLDLRMPVMDGFETATAMRESEEYYAGIPVIGLSADAISETPERILNAGMNECLSKPVSRDDLEKLLHKWLPADDAQKTGVADTRTPSILELQHMLAEELPHYQVAIRQHLEDGDSARLYEVAHKIAGGSAYCDMPVLASAAHALQNAARQNDSAAIKRQGRHLLDTIDTVLAGLKAQ